MVSVNGVGGRSTFFSFLLFVRDAQLSLSSPTSLSYLPDHFAYLTFPQGPSPDSFTIPSHFLVLSTTS